MRVSLGDLPLLSKPYTSLCRLEMTDIILKSFNFRLKTGIPTYILHLSGWSSYRCGQTVKTAGATKNKRVYGLSHGISECSSFESIVCTTMKETCIIVKLQAMKKKIVFSGTRCRNWMCTNPSVQFSINYFSDKAFSCGRLRSTKRPPSTLQ